jgi:hypothetical protein
MKYLFTLLILLFSFNTNAQLIAIKDTIAVITILDSNNKVIDHYSVVDEYKDTTKIIIPAYVAKQIVLDLMSGDSAKAQLVTMYDMYKITEQKTKIQDSMISAYQVKNQTYAQQIVLYKEKEQQYINYTKTLKSDVKKAKFKNHLFTGTGMLLILGGALLLFSLNANAQLIAIKDTIAIITVTDSNHKVINHYPVVNEYKDTTKIIIPAYVAKQIVLDLMSGDSAKAQLTVLYDMYKATEQKTKMQDSMISAYQVKTQAYAKQILLYKEKESQYINYTKDLKKDVKKAKLKNHLATGAGMLVILGGLLFLFVSSGK